MLKKHAEVKKEHKVVHEAEPKVEKKQHLFRADRVEQKKLEGFKVVDTKLNPQGLVLMEK